MDGYRNARNVETFINEIICHSNIHCTFEYVKIVPENYYTYISRMVFEIYFSQASISNTNMLV